MTKPNGQHEGRKPPLNGRSGVEESDTPSTERTEQSTDDILRQAQDEFVSTPNLSSVEQKADFQPGSYGCIFATFHFLLSGFVAIWILVDGMGQTSGPGMVWLLFPAFILLFPFALLTLAIPVVNLLAVALNSFFWGWVVSRLTKRRTASRR